VQVYEPGALGFGEQFGETDVRFMTTGFAPSVRICSDSVLGEMYAGLTFEAVPIDAGCCAGCALSAFARAGGTDVVLPPLLHPLTKTAPQNDAARTACAKRLANFETLALLTNDPNGSWIRFADDEDDGPMFADCSLSTAANQVRCAPG
jgi:hypothetical protein